MTAGATATFTATASGSPTPTVRWQQSTNRGRSWSNASGASSTSTTYTFTAQTSQNGYEYRAVFSNSGGSTASNAATLTVTANPTAPSITSNPANDTVGAGSTASFTSTASGTPTPTVQWQVNTGSGWNNVSSGGTSTTYSFTAQTSQNGYQYRAVFTNGVGSPATSNAATLTVTAAMQQSSNWSGYAGTGSNFNSVSGTWTVPTVTCTRTTSYSAQWIGIDGYSSSTVEQDGTEADCSGGSPVYDAWYEMYGDNAVNNGYEVELSPSTNPVSPGDTITASVSVSNSNWTLSLTDSVGGTNKWTYSTDPIAFSAAQTSAEWIVERPETCSIFGCSLTTLSNYGTVTFSNSLATENGTQESIAALSGVPIEMVNGSTPISVPGALDSTGEIFTMTYE